MLIRVRGKLLAHNLFAYCMNEPIGNADPSGHAPMPSIIELALFMQNFLCSKGRNPSAAEIGAYIDEYGKKSSGGSGGNKGGNNKGTTTPSLRDTNAVIEWQDDFGAFGVDTDYVNGMKNSINSKSDYEKQFKNEGKAILDQKYMKNGEVQTLYQILVGSGNLDPMKKNQKNMMAQWMLSMIYSGIYTLEIASIFPKMSWQKYQEW